jgi:hypothetical protein
MVETQTGDIDVGEVNVALNLPETNYTFIDAARKWLDDLVQDIKSGTDETLAIGIGGLMIVVAAVYIWRRV